MPAKVSAKRYAEALLELAVDRGEVDDWSGALDRLARELGGVLTLLRAPSIPLAVRQRALDAATGGEPAAIRALLSMLLEREAVGALSSIARLYRDLVDARAGIEKAVITTATPLPARERRDLVARLERSTGKKLRSTFAVDPAALGGVVVRIGDHQVDGSVRTRLARLREELSR